MAYSTQQDLIDRFGAAELKQLTDRADPPLDAIDATVVTRAIDDADDLIDSYIGKRYDLPLVTVPDRLKRVSADIARYHLHADAPTETVRRAFEDAMKFLADVAAGRAVLDVAGSEPAATAGTVKTSGPDRVFTGDSLKEF